MSIHCAATTPTYEAMAGEEYIGNEDVLPPLSLLLLLLMLSDPLQSAAAKSSDDLAAGRPPAGANFAKNSDDRDAGLGLIV